MQPDHTENAFLFKLLDATKNTGITLTESLAMLPQNSVSTLMFANEKAFYFSVNEIDREKLARSYGLLNAPTIEIVSRKDKVDRVAMLREQAQARKMAK